MKTDEVYVGQILDAAEQIGRYVGGLTAEAFLTDPLRQDAVSRQLEVIGEASRRLSTPFKAARPEIAWQAIVGLWNRLAHDYLGVDMEILWEVVQHDLPVLTAALR